MMENQIILLLCLSCSAVERIIMTIISLDLEGCPCQNQLFITVVALIVRKWTIRYMHQNYNNLNKTFKDAPKYIL